MRGDPLFEVRQAVFSLGPDGPRRRASFRLEAGQAAWVIGRSGTGKTSLLKVLAGLRPLLSGEMLVEGRPATNFHVPAWRRRVVYIPQKPVMLPGTVEENLSLAFRFHTAQGTSYPSERAETLISSLGLEAKLMQTKAGALSGGEQSRVALARALLINPRVVLADEPLAHLDAVTRKLISTALALYAKDYSAGVVFVSHDSLIWPQPVEEVAVEGGF